jgi:DNA polymerase I-like protein with 3'-5' exonuclease and polymerase domains
VSPNELINAPIQADEAIIVLTAMAELAEMGDPRFVANMEIHDDLTFFWHVDEIERNAETVIDTMLNTPYEWAHIVPIGVEMAVGDDWESVKGVGEYFSDQWSGRIPKKVAA